MEEQLKEQLKTLAGETWTSMGGNYTKALPLFHTNELDRVELVIKALEGMTISSAKELLKKIPSALEQLLFIR